MFLVVAAVPLMLTHEKNFLSCESLLNVEV